MITVLLRLPRGELLRQCICNKYMTGGKYGGTLIILNLDTTMMFGHWKNK